MSVVNYCKEIEEQIQKRNIKAGYALTSELLEDVNKIVFIPDSMLGAEITMSFNAKETLFILFYNMSILKSAMYIIIEELRNIGYKKIDFKISIATIDIGK